jgi:hypothetical protein
VKKIRMQKPFVRGKGKAVTECIHADRPYFCKGMCKSCYTRVWERENPERRERYLARRCRYNHEHREQRIKQNGILSMKRLYNLTLEGYELLLKNQNGGCAVCGIERDCNKRLAVDHDHGTNKVRGLLCLRCNTKLGWYEKFAKQIAQYLSQSKED